MADSRELPITGLERALLAAAFVFYALGVPLCFSVFRPGFCAYDEEGVLDQIQAWREGHTLLCGIGWGSVHKWLCAGLVALGGPHLGLLHLPTFAAVLFEALLLYAWLKPKAGERAAVWAVLANLVAAATFARAESIPGCGMLPFFFLVGALACERGRGPWPSFLAGFYLGAMLLDYEGWTGALLFLGPYALWLRRGRPAPLACVAAGALAGFGAALAASHDFLRKIGARVAVSTPELGLAGQVWSNVRNLALPAERHLFADAAFHTWPTPWIWVPALVGVLIAARGHRWLLWLLVSGSAALAIKGTGYEPQRLSLAYLGLCALAGIGVARLWGLKHGPRLCLLLLTLGAADEIWAWAAVPDSYVARYYGESVQWERSALWLAQRQPAAGWRVITGLGDDTDAAFRFLLAGEGVRPGGSVAVAVVHADFRPALATLSPAPCVRIGNERPVFLYFPAPGDARRLEGVAASLDGLRQMQATSIPGVVSGARDWLQAPGHGDPWSRTVAWDLWLRFSLFTSRVDPAGMQAMLNDSLVSAWAPDEVAELFHYAHPGVASCFSDKAADIDPSLAGLDLEGRVEQY